MMLKAVFFDAAGTLFRVRGSVGLAYATVAARHGVGVDAPDIERRFREALGRMPPLCFPGVPDTELLQAEQAWWRRLVAQAFAGFAFRDFEAFFRDLFEHFARADGWELFPDTTPALIALQARGLRLGVVSNFDARLTAICDGLGISGHFEAVVMSSRTGYAKPDPRIFAIALQRLGVSPAEAMHVGDSEAEDVKGARAAGLGCVLLQREARGVQFQPQIADLRGLLPLTG